MDEMEKVFAEGLRKAASGRPAIAVDVDEVIARGEAAGRVPVGRRSWRWLAAAAAVLLVAGIGAGAWYLNRPGAVPAVPVGSPSAAPVVLTGTRWLATEIGGRPVVESASTARRESVPWLEFDATTMSGADPCNGVGADYRMDGDRISFGNWGAHTALGCHIAQQQRFERALMDTTRVQRDGDELEFLDDAGTVVLRFRSAAGSMAAPTLTGTLWVATDLWGAADDGGRAHTSVDPDTAATLRLADGTASLDATCGRFTADYTVDGDQLAFGEQTATGAGCGAGQAKVIWLMLRASLGGEVRYRLTDTTLELRDQDGNRLVRFVAGSGSSTSPIVSPAVPSGSASVQGQVTFRVRNDTTVRLTGLTVEPDDGVQIGFGTLDPGGSADMVSTGQPVYRYPLVGVTLDGRSYELVPTDVGEEWPLTPGEYTYALSVDGSGDLRLSLEKDG